MQYTYLSRALNREDTHLSEDQLYSVAQQLDFFTDEIEYLFLLRAHAVTRHPNRRGFLEAKIKKMRNARDIRAETREDSSIGNGETKFLLSPLTWITYFMLEITEYRENPKRIGKALGISDEKLLEGLKTLSEQALIETEGSPWKIKRTLESHFHYGTGHPLTRIHQHLLKDMAAHHLTKIAERDKMGYMVTFNADDSSAKIIQSKFREFLQEVEKIAVKAPSRRTFQMTFDLFPWN